VRPRAQSILGHAAAYAATLGLWLSYAGYGFNPWDECVLAYGGVRILEGQMIWVDFFGYAPGRYLLAALFYELGGVDLWTLRVGFSALFATMPLLAYSTARRLMPPGWALLPAVLVALGPSVYYFRPFPFVALLGGWSLCRLIEAPSLRRQLEHGLALFACAILESAAGGFVVVLTPLALWLAPGPWVSGPRAVLAATLRCFAAAAAAALPVLGVYAWQGKLVEALTLQTYRYVVTGASMWVGYPRPWVSLWSGDVQRAMQESFFWACALALAAAPAYAAAALARGRRRFAPLGSSHAAEPQMLLLCLLALLSYLLPLYRAGFFNVLRAAPLPWILGAFLAAHLADAGGRTPPWRRALSGALLLYALGFGAHLMTYREYRNISTGSPPGAALRADLVPMDDARAALLVERRHADLVRTAKGWIQRDTAPDDPIFSVPLGPLFYFFGRRQNPTSHDYILPGYWRDAEQLEETIRTLRRRPPKLLLYSNVPVDGDPMRRFSVYSAPLFEHLLGRHAWTDRHPYPLGPGNVVTFYNFRRLRPEAHWPSGLEAASRALAPALVSGPAEPRPAQIAGAEVHAWLLRPMSVLEIEASRPEPEVLLFRYEAADGRDGWAQPELRLSVLRPGAEPEVLSLRPEPSAARLPPMVAIRLPPHPDGPTRVRLQVPPGRPEHLGAAWVLAQMALMPEREAFYAPGEPVPPEPAP
jgi:hypothetical protein